ncbi:RNA polymerase sigma factor [Flavihumibacter sp. UBA7668]|uniref:RNA polymerase sigma factor n=1 Tax=Flavihumibacter sp. UBA7668 TaxID=1946542 RepID=UPI0025B890E3|nr:sigma-70 family RNA polymerase sigma factor [Flavihumibacter sp. UBA7668]
MPAKKNQKEEISAWYEQYRDQLSHFAMRLGCQHCEAEDLINQLFLELWEKQTDLSTIVQPKTFLLTALKRRMIDQFRKKKSNLFVVTDDMQEADMEPGIQSRLEQLEDQAQLTNKLASTYASLPKRLKEVVYLKYYKGYSTSDIASSFGISHRTVYNSLFEAIKLFRTKLSKK